MKEEKKVAVKTPDLLQLKVARSLVNSPEWTKHLDLFFDEYIKENSFSSYKWNVSVDNAFYEKWESSDSLDSKIFSVIEVLLHRQPAESERENFLYALFERFQALHDIHKIQDTFGVPKEKRIKEIKLFNNRIELKRSLEPILEFMGPDLENDKKFKILIRLKEIEKANAWLDAFLTDPNLTSYDYRKKILFMLLDAINTDIRFLDYLTIPEHLADEVTYLQVYQFLFHYLIDIEADKLTIDRIWSMIPKENRFEVLRASLQETGDRQVIMSYLLEELPENWVDHESYRSLCLDAYKLALEEEVITHDLAKKFAQLFKSDINLLYKALDQSFELSARNFSFIITDFIHELGFPTFERFIYENFGDLVELGLVFENAELLEIVWNVLDQSKQYRQEIVDYLNDEIDEIIEMSNDWDSESIAKFIVPKLNEKNKQRFMLSYMCQNLNDNNVARYFQPMLTEVSREKIKDHCDKIREELIASPWYKEDAHFKLIYRVSGFSNTQDTLSTLFGRDYALKYHKSIYHIIKFTEFFFTKLSKLKDIWSTLDENLKIKLIPLILSNSFINYNELFIADRVKILYEGLSREQILTLESELFLPLDNIRMESFSFWLSHYATEQFILKVNSNMMAKVISFNLEKIRLAADFLDREKDKKNSITLIFHILDVLEKHGCLDHLTVPVIEKEIQDQWFVLPYLIKGYLESNELQIHSGNLERALCNHLCKSFQYDDLKILKLLERMSSWIGVLMNTGDEDSKVKLIKLTSSIIKLNKMLNITGSLTVEHEEFFCLMVTELLSDRKNNPLLSPEGKRFKSGFFKLKNPIDGQECRSLGEQTLISLYDRLRLRYPQYFKQEGSSLSGRRWLK